jgi:replicative DNA helicase
MMTRAFSSGWKPLFAVRTAHRMVRASGNHPFLTHRGWIPVEALEVGEEVAVRDGSRILWEPIESIESSRLEEVFDATVEEAHNFVANGFIVHNSIEQDADSVVFLLRRDYYDPLDKPGMAEVIVAKNRHGGVGTVNLTFRKEIAQFGTYSPLKQQQGQIVDAGPGSFADFESSLAP